MLFNTLLLVAILIAELARLVFTVGS